MAARKNTAKSEDPPVYTVRTTITQDDDVIAAALRILESRLRKPGQTFTAPSEAKDYCLLKFAGLPREEFSCLFLDAQHRLIECEVLAFGTLTQTSVYPREVVKAALRHNAAAVILCHNHPSGSAEPSRADEYLTNTLKQSLALVDVRVLDHFVVGRMHVVSFAERGLL